MMISFVILLSVFLNFATNFHFFNGELLWSDEFDGPSGSQPSKDLWTYEVGDGSDHGLIGWGNKELQYYTDHLSNVGLDGEGHLVITARQSNSSWDLKCYYGNCQYTSARLISKYARHFGRFEARIKLPSGKGLWPAFWLLGDNYGCVGWPNSGEMDVMEMRGSRPNTVVGILQGPGYSAGNGMWSSFTLPAGQTFEDDFHVFAIDWEAHRITWSVDDDVYVSRTPDDLGNKPWVFDHPFHMLINLAVGGTFDNEPDSDVTFPKMMYIDYIRVYEKTRSGSVSYPIITSANTNLGALLWSAEFDTKNGTAPSAEQWNYDLADGPDGPIENKGWGNAEQQYYTNDTSNSATDGIGNLVIMARTDTASKYDCYYGKCLYTSTRLKTYGKFAHTYGRFEARLKMPSGKGLWPAFWLLGDNIGTVGWPECGTISMEMKGSMPKRITATLHGPGYSNSEGIQAEYYLPGGESFADDFHVFAIDWEPNRIMFSVDGNNFNIVTPADLRGNRWVFDHPFHIIINLAVGGLYDGYPPAGTVFPKCFYVDYIRVYDQASGTGFNEVR